MEKPKRLYCFTGWNIAMAATHALPNLDELFPKPETLQAEELYPRDLLKNHKIHL